MTAKINSSLIDLALQRLKQAFVPSDAASQGGPPGPPPMPGDPNAGMPPMPPGPPPMPGDPNAGMPPMPPGAPPGPPPMPGDPNAGMPPMPQDPSGGMTGTDIDSKIQTAIRNALQGAGLAGSSNPKQAKPDINTIATDVFQLKKMVQHDLRLRGVELPPEILDGPNRDPVTGAAAMSPTGGSDVPAGVSLSGGQPPMGKAAAAITWPDVVKAAAELVALRNWQLELDDARAMAWSPEPQTKAAAVEPPSFGVEYGDKPHRRISDKAAALSMVLSRRRVS